MISLLLKNYKYLKLQGGAQNKRKRILHLKNIIIYKFMTYFYTEKCFFYQFPMPPAGYSAESAGCHDGSRMAPFSLARSKDKQLTANPCRARVLG